MNAIVALETCQMAPILPVPGAPSFQGKRVPLKLALIAMEC